MRINNKNKTHREIFATVQQRLQQAGGPGRAIMYILRSINIYFWEKQKIAKKNKTWKSRSTVKTPPFVLLLTKSIVGFKTSSRPYHTPWLLASRTMGNSSFDSTRHIIQISFAYSHSNFFFVAAFLESSTITTNRSLKKPFFFGRGGGGGYRRISRNAV